MSGPKLDSAKESIRILLSSLDESDFMNLLLFNETVFEWHPDSDLRDRINSDEEVVLLDAFAADSNTTSSAINFTDSIEAAGNSNLVGAIVHGLKLDERVWVSHSLPEIAHTMMVIVTDGRGSRNQTQKMKTAIRLANQVWSQHHFFSHKSHNCFSQKSKLLLKKVKIATHKSHNCFIQKSQLLLTKVKIAFHKSHNCFSLATRWPGFLCSSWALASTPRWTS